MSSVEYAIVINRRKSALIYWGPRVSNLILSNQEFPGLATLMADNKHWNWNDFYKLTSSPISKPENTTMQLFFQEEILNESVSTTTRKKWQSVAQWLASWLTAKVINLMFDGRVFVILSLFLSLHCTAQSSSSVRKRKKKQEPGGEGTVDVIQSRLERERERTNERTTLGECEWAPSGSPEKRPSV